MKPIEIKKKIPVYDSEALWHSPMDALPPYPFYDDEGIYYDEDAPYNPKAFFESAKTTVLNLEVKLSQKAAQKSWKKPITLRVDEDVLQAFKQMFPDGYQQEINRLMREATGL